MALFTKAELTHNYKKRESSESIFRIKTASQMLTEEAKRFRPASRYTIFLSHSSRDAEIILELERELEGMGYTVYVDWIEDPQLDRSHVSIHTAELLRKRMLACECLFYATTESSLSSKWMPWECGYMDGAKNKVAILPIAESSAEKYNGQEYLGLYPYVSKRPLKGISGSKLWINESESVGSLFDNWLSEGVHPQK